jgi:hypothetical protein
MENFRPFYLCHVEGELIYCRFGKTCPTNKAETKRLTVLSNSQEQKKKPECKVRKMGSMPRLPFCLEDA